MRKVLSVFSVLISIFCLTGCGNTKTLECKKVEKLTYGDANQTMIMKFKNNKLYYITLNMDLEISKGLNYKNSFIISNIDKNLTLYKNLKGVKYSLKETDKGAIYKVKFDINKMDKDAKDKTKISINGTTYDDNKKSLEVSGFKCN